jgi:hypothetical protein
VGLTGLTGEEHRSDQCATMQSGDFERRTRVGIARLASRLSKFAVVGHPSDGVKTKFPKVPLGGCILVLGLRGILVFRLATI